MLVSMMSAPASRYSRWMPAMMSGWVIDEQVVVADEVGRPVGEPLAAVAGLVRTIPLDGGAHGAVEDHDPLTQQRSELVGRVRPPVVGTRCHVTPFRYGRRPGNSPSVADPGSVATPLDVTDLNGRNRPLSDFPHAGTQRSTPSRSPGQRRPARPRLDEVMEIEDTPALVRPVVIAAFEGWNDAAEAASAVVDHLLTVWNARVVAAIDPEDYYDFQVNRPTVGVDDNGFRKLTWPSTHIAVASPPGPRPRRDPHPWHRAEHAVARVLRRAARVHRRSRW